MMIIIIFYKTCTLYIILSTHFFESDTTIIITAGDVLTQGQGDRTFPAILAYPP